MTPKLIDLLTEGHELYFPPLVEAMEVNADFAAVIERAIGAERMQPYLLAACYEVQDGFQNGTITYTRKRQADSDPYHPATVALYAALAQAEGGE